MESKIFNYWFISLSIIAICIIQPAQGSYVMTDSLNYKTGRQLNCELIIAGVTVIDCESEHYIFNTDNLLKSGLRGLKNHGGPGKIIGAHAVVEKIYQGHMAEVNTQEKILYKLVKTSAGVSSPHPDVFKIKIA